VHKVITDSSWVSETGIITDQTENGEQPYGHPHKAAHHIREQLSTGYPAWYISTTIHKCFRPDGIHTAQPIPIPTNPHEKQKIIK